MSDAERDEFVRGIKDAERGIRFRFFASRPWKRGWRLKRTQNRYLRKFQSVHAC